jgi:hypothetical protein
VNKCDRMPYGNSLGPRRPHLLPRYVLSLFSLYRDMA